MRSVKFFTKRQLIEANKVAIRTKRNRTLYPEKLEQLADDFRFPVAFSFVHNDVELRLWIALDARPTMAWLDVPFETYAALASADIDEGEEGAA